MFLSGFFQNRRPLNVRIQRLSQRIQLIVPKLFILCKTLFVICFLQIVCEYAFKICQICRILCTESVMGVQRHQIVYHHHQAAAIDQTVIHMYKETVESLREFYHHHFAHRTIVAIQCLKGPVLHYIIRLGKTHTAHIFQRNISGIMFDQILPDLALLIRLGKT